MNKVEKLRNQLAEQIQIVENTKQELAAAIEEEPKYSVWEIAADCYHESIIRVKYNAPKSTTREEAMKYAERLNRGPNSEYYHYTVLPDGLEITRR